MEIDPDGTNLFLIATSAITDITPGPSGIILIAIAATLTLLSALFCAGHAAISYLGTVYIDNLLEDDEPLYKTLVKLEVDSDKFNLSSIIFTSITTFFASALLSLYFAADIARAVIRAMGFEFVGAMTFIAPIVVTFLFFILFLLFGRFIPRYIGIANAENTVKSTASFIKTMVAISKPLLLLCTGLSKLICKLFGIDISKVRGNITEEGIMQLVDRGEELGVIEESQKQMIENIFQFDDRAVGEVMTHRKEVVAVEDSTPIIEIIEIAQEEGYSRLPVYCEDIDNIVGILNVKDLLKFIGSELDTDLASKDLMRDALYIPESNHCREVFALMQKKKAQIAVVIDEYGGTAGIVSLEDIIEAIVGEIQDEYDEEEESVVRSEDGSIIIDGSYSVYDTAKLLGIELPDEDGYETIGGFVTHILGRIPTDGEHPSITFAEYDFTVTESGEKRIKKITAKKSENVTTDSKPV